MANAKERFQGISDAYQVLSDKERRRAYDKQGRSGAGESFVDAQIFFNVPRLLAFVAQVGQGKQLRISKIGTQFQLPQELHLSGMSQTGFMLKLSSSDISAAQRGELPLVVLSAIE